MYSLSRMSIGIAAIARNTALPSHGMAHARLHVRPRCLLLKSGMPAQGNVSRAYRIGRLSGVWWRHGRMRSKV